MAIGDAYATATQYKAVTGRVSAADDTIIDRDLKAVSRYLDFKLGRPLGFGKDASAVARIYHPSAWLGAYPLLDVGDTVSVSTIAIDENEDNTFSVALVTADYELLPRNAATGPEARPYQQIGLTKWGSRDYWHPGQRVKVTAVGGWPAVPDAIVAAAIELAAILRIESPRATNRVNELNQVLSTSRAAQGIIADLIGTYSDPRVSI